MQDNSHKSVNEEKISRSERRRRKWNCILRIEKYATKIFSQKIMRIFVAALRSNETGKQIWCRHAGTRWLPRWCLYVYAGMINDDRSMKRFSLSLFFFFYQKFDISEKFSESSKMLHFINKNYFRNMILFDFDEIWYIDWPVQNANIIVEYLKEWF